MDLSQQRMKVRIKWMVRRDMPEVLAIEAESFDFPWLKEDFIYHLRKRNIIGMVAKCFDEDEKVVGFMIYMLQKRKIELLNFGVARKWRRLSIGTQMVEMLKKKLSVERRSSILLRVQERNLGAQLFFRSMGFRALSVERRYWDTDVDAYLMVHRLRQSMVDDDSESYSYRGEDASHF